MSATPVLESPKSLDPLAVQGLIAGIAAFPLALLGLGCTPAIGISLFASAFAVIQGVRIALRPEKEPVDLAVGAIGAVFGVLSFLGSMVMILAFVLVLLTM